MFSALVRQLILLLVSLFVLSVLSYLILLQDPLNEILAKPNILAGYSHYLQALLHGDLGITYNGGDELKDLLFTVLPPTLQLCFTALLLAAFFGIPLGFIGAMNSHNLLGSTIRNLSALGLSTPIFWIAPILLYVSAIQAWEISAIGQYNLLYEIQPVTGFPIIDVWFIEQPYRTKVIQNVLQHLILPSLVLTILPTMDITRLIQQRAEFVFSQNYVKVAGTRGWSQLQILRTYVLRNTLPLLLPQLPRLFILVLTQSMLIESTFGWPGIGRWLIDSVTLQDYNSISVGIIAIGICIISVYFIATTLAFTVDPLNKKGWYAR